MKIEVLARFSQNVLVDPLDVIDELFDLEFDEQYFIPTEIDGKFYLCGRPYYGADIDSDKKEIDKELYDYLIALSVVSRYIKNNKK